MTDVVGTIAGFSHVPGSGLVTMYLNLDDGTGYLIHGDWRPMNRIAEELGIGARVKVEYDDEGHEIIIPLDVEE